MAVYFLTWERQICCNEQGRAGKIRGPVRKFKMGPNLTRKI
jgi:hypothetical protein